MRTFDRHATTLFLGLALVAGACSGGGDEAATTPITPVPTAASPDSGPDLSGLLNSPEAVSTTVTTTAAERADAEQFVQEFLTVYFEASANREWDAVYDASSNAFADVCSADEFAALTASFSAEPSAIEFVGDFDVSVVGDFATGRLEISDEVGTLPVEGLLAVAEADGWRVAINPCDVATKVASGDFSYPVIITTTTNATPISESADGAGETASVEAPIDPAVTLPDTAGVGDSATTTTVPDILGPPPIAGSTTTTTTLPPIPLSGAEQIEIEAVIRQFIAAEASQDYVSLYDAVPPLFTCSAGDTASALGSFPWSPTGVTFGTFDMIRGNVGHNDEAFATFDVTYLDSGETLTITDFGVWEWGGTWYAAVHPCKWTENTITHGAGNLKAVNYMDDILEVARVLYAGAGDYDIPTSTLNAMFIDEEIELVGTPDQAGVNVFAYVDLGPELHVVTQSSSGHWYCFVENAVTGAHFGASFLPDTIDTPNGCRSVTLTDPWSVL